MCWWGMEAKVLGRSSHTTKHKMIVLANQEHLEFKGQNIRGGGDRKVGQKANCLGLILFVWKSIRDFLLAFSECY